MKEAELAATRVKSLRVKSLIWRHSPATVQLRVDKAVLDAADVSDGERQVTSVPDTSDLPLFAALDAADVSAVEYRIERR